MRGRKYELPDHVTCLMAKHPWMEAKGAQRAPGGEKSPPLQVNWLEEDAGPGTKLLGAADWFQRSIGRRKPQSPSNARFFLLAVTCCLSDRL